MADLTDLIITSTMTFYEHLKADPNGRYKSWEYCYKCFHDARDENRPDIDYLSLQLAFYLASWGMYRGSSFLLQKDYKVHVPVVEELLKSEYDCLFGIECIELKKPSVQKALQKIEQFMNDYYESIRVQVRGVEFNNKLSSTLITKILMGTLGCVPAYDINFVTAVRAYKITTGIYNIKSLLGLVKFYEKNEDRLEKARSKMKVFDLPYPQMKLLDMGFWQMGFEISGKNESM